jgi:hypothetical protein
MTIGIGHCADCATIGHASRDRIRRSFTVQLSLIHVTGTLSATRRGAAGAANAMRCASASRERNGTRTRKPELGNANAQRGWGPGLGKGAQRQAEAAPAAPHSGRGTPWAHRGARRPGPLPVALR